MSEISGCHVFDAVAMEKVNTMYRSTRLSTIGSFPGSKDT